MAKKMTALQELAALKLENAALAAKIKAKSEAANGSLSRLGITTKGTAMTVYCHGFRFPLTIFPDQFKAIIDNKDEITAHLAEHGLLKD